MLDDHHHPSTSTILLSFSPNRFLSSSSSYDYNDQNSGAANCIGDWEDCYQAHQELFSVTTAEAQQWLILAAAGLTLIKCALGAVSYSYYHVAVGGASLLCTVLALTVFTVKDYKHATLLDQIQAGYGDDAQLFILAYCGAVLLSWTDVLTTRQTMATVQRIKAQPETYGYERKEFKTGAASIYGKALLLATVLCGCLPLVAFGRSGWEPAHFGPTNFDQDNAKLLMSALILYLITHGLLAATIAVVTISPASLMVATFVSSCLGLMPMLGSAALFWLVTGRVEQGAEAGGLCYLLLILLVQGTTFAGEFTRHVHWLQIELLGKALLFQQQQQEQQAADERILAEFKAQSQPPNMTTTTTDPYGQQPLNTNNEQMHLSHSHDSSMILSMSEDDDEVGIEQRV